MSQQDPNVNLALVEARIRDRALEASKWRLAKRSSQARIGRIQRQTGQIDENLVILAR